MNEEKKNKIKKLFEEKKYHESIEELSRIINENKNDYEAYFNRGISKNNLELDKEAIKDFDKTIEINPKYCEAYINRGLSKFYLKLYEESIVDYDKSIKINPNFSEAYNNRGISKKYLSLYKEAIEDFDKAIQINPNFSVAYNNRGITKLNLGLLKEAKEDFNKVIELNNNDSKAYFNSGISYYKLNDNKNSDESFQKAVGFNKYLINNIITFFISEIIESKNIYEKINSIIKEYNVIENDNTYNFIISNIKKEVIDKDINTYIKKILLLEYLLLYILAVRNEEIIINHHTSLHNLLNIIKNNNNDENNNYIRISPITTANDPEEGKVLEKILKNNNCNININSDNNLITFQTSFTRNKDSLNMFRLYGRDIKTNEEATGVSIVINKEYFNFDYSTTLPTLEPICMNSNFNKTEQNNYNKSINNKRDLYWLLYYNKDTNQLIYNPNQSKYEHIVINLNKNDNKEYNKTSRLIKDIFIKILETTEELDDHINKLENSKEIKEEIYYTLFENIRYIIKDEAFYEEQELRILCTTTPDNKSIEVDKNIDKLYIKYIPLFDSYVEEIILGSKIKDKEAVKDYLQALLNEKYSENKIKISISKAPLR